MCSCIAVLLCTKIQQTKSVYGIVLYGIILYCLSAEHGQSKIALRTLPRDGAYTMSQHEDSTVDDNVEKSSVTLRSSLSTDDIIARTTWRCDNVAHDNVTHDNVQTY